MKSLMQSEALVACFAGSQRGWSPAPSDHRICESPVSNFSSYCWKLCWTFWGFHYDFPHPQPFISTLARISNEGPWRGCSSCFGSWPAAGKIEVLKCVSTFQLILLISDRWQQRYGASLKSVTFWGSLGACPGRAAHNTRACFYMSHSIMIFLGLLAPIYQLVLPGCLCPISYKSCLPAVCVFVRVSCVPWNGSPCKCTLLLCPSWFPCCGHILFSTCFGQKRLINACREPCWDILVPRTFLAYAFSPSFLYRCSFWATGIPPTHPRFSWASFSLIPCFFLAVTLLVPCHPSSWDTVEPVGIRSICLHWAPILWGPVATAQQVTALN